VSHDVAKHSFYSGACEVLEEALLKLQGRRRPTQKIPRGRGAAKAALDAAR